jgi:uncharacterized protein (TIGR03435 family)
MTLRTRVAAVTVLLSPVLAQPPKFEVASVKPTSLPRCPENPFAANVPGIAGNRVTAIGTLNNLIRTAYNVTSDRILGGPSWTACPGASSYDVVAKTEGEGTPSTEQVRLMLQALLADRFQLKLHRETKDLPVYQLVIGKNGPKLTESASDTEPSGSIVPGRSRIVMTKRSMDELAQDLLLFVDYPIVNRTGLTGFYDFSLKVNYDFSAGGDPGRVSVLTAVQEQLGLKLKPAKEPTEVLVIEHAEKPSGN